MIAAATHLDCSKGQIASEWRGAPGNPMPEPSSRPQLIADWRRTAQDVTWISMCLQEPLPPYVGKPSAPQVFRGDALVKSFTRPSQLHRHQWMASLGREAGQPISIWVREYDEGRIWQGCKLV